MELISHPNGSLVIHERGRVAMVFRVDNDGAYRTKDKKGKILTGFAKEGIVDMEPKYMYSFGWAGDEWYRVVPQLFFAPPKCSTTGIIVIQQGTATAVPLDTGVWRT